MWRRCLAGLLIGLLVFPTMGLVGGATPTAAESASPSVPASSMSDRSSDGFLSVQTYAAPPESVSPNATAEQISAAGIKRSTVPAGSFLIVEIRFGSLLRDLLRRDAPAFAGLNEGDTIHPQAIQALNDRTANQPSIAIQAGGAHTGTNSAVDFGGAAPSSVFARANKTTGSLFIIVDTGSADAFSSPAPVNSSYEVRVDYRVDGDRFMFTDTGPIGGAGGDPKEAAFPYADPTETLTTTRSVAIVAPDGTFESPTDTSGVVGPQAGTALVASRTNAVPGTNATVVAVTQSRHRTAVSIAPNVLVGANGTLSTTIPITGAGTVAVYADQRAFGRTSVASTSEDGAPSFSRAAATASRRDAPWWQSELSLGHTLAVINPPSTPPDSTYRLKINGVVVEEARRSNAEQPLISYTVFPDLRPSGVEWSVTTDGWSVATGKLSD